MRKRDFPLIRGNVVGKQIFVWCPYCREKHVHGYLESDGMRPTHRVAHCLTSANSQFKKGYLIAPWRKTDSEYQENPEKELIPVSAAVLIDMADVKRSRPITRFLKGTREVALLDETRNLSRAYRVDLDRIPDAAALLGWIEHISEKVWLKPRHIIELIKHAERENGITIDRGI